jgi:predicted DNA repair protein MutK
LDDIAALMDDVVVMSKIATKTAGILGDDLLLMLKRHQDLFPEKPRVVAITKAHFLNKLIILPLVFLLSYFVPWLITVVLILGAIYLHMKVLKKYTNT